MEMPVVETLHISKDEVAATAERVRNLLRLNLQSHLSETTITRLSEEWITVAKRLKKGQQLLDRETDEERLANLTGLYTFLLKILGIYDLFFKQNLPDHHYRYIQGVVLDILK